MQEKGWGWLAESGSRTILRNPSHVPLPTGKSNILFVQFASAAPNDVTARFLAVWHSRNQRDPSSSSLSYINRSTICLLALCVYRSSIRLSYASTPGELRTHDEETRLFLSLRFWLLFAFGQLAAKTLTDRTVSKFAFRFSKRNRTNDPSVMQHRGPIKRTGSVQTL